MKTTLFSLGVLVASFTAFPAFGQKWSATCQGIQFKFDREEKLATVSLLTAKGAFVVASGPITFDNGTALRATLDGGTPNETVKLSQIGLNKSRDIVYTFSKSGESKEVRDGVFCDAAISVIP